MEKGLEQDQVKKEEKRVRKEYTAEELQQIAAAAGTLKELGVSENLKAVIDAAGEWGNKEAQADAKKALVDAFGGTEKLKAYLENEYPAEIAAFAGLRSLMTQMNSVAGYYKRREPAKRKIKVVKVNIDNVTYDVNKEFMESIANEPKEIKRKLVLEHPDTKVFTPVCADVL